MIVQDNTATQILIQEAEIAFQSLSRPFMDVRFPPLQDDSHPFNVPAVWTLDDTRPRWNNLAVLVGAVKEGNGSSLAFWGEVHNTFDPRLTVLANGEYYMVLTKQQNEVQRQLVLPSELPQALAEKCDALFAPSKLAAIRGGQLMFADLDAVLPKESIQVRHRKRLDDALSNALIGALEAQRKATGDTREQDAAVIEVAIAYLAARILADKGFFTPYPPSLSINDPRKLLKLTSEHTNGFFSHICNDVLRTMDDETLQQFAAYLGSSVSFTLIDDRDVGYIYEKSLIRMSKMGENKSQDLLSTMQHYTPIAIAERMLKSLPLERLRPEERVIFDPAAGSGTLLLAATKRLAAMPDVQLLDKKSRRNYLANHVIGNDIDSDAALITTLRYILVQETLSSQSFPSPAQFSSTDYMHDETWPASPRPRVLVANPPFANVKGKQNAVAFLKKALEHLQAGDQFAFLLPQIFLTGTKDEWLGVRKSIGERCHVLEMWQLPEGAIGLQSEQSMCVVSGIVESHKPHFTLARAVVSRSQTEWVSELGFPGQAWIGSVDGEQWRAVVAPVIQLPDTIPLERLFFVYGGVPDKFVEFISHSEDEVTTKRFWKNSWRGRGKCVLWANPDLAPAAERYVHYEVQNGNEQEYDSPKILVSRSTNRSSVYPISAYFDSVGLYPNTDMYCIVPISSQERIKHSSAFDTVWESLNDTDRMYWLLGILNAELAINIILPDRDVRHTDKSNWQQFPLPTTIDREIITLVDKIIQHQQHNVSDEEIAPLRKRLNEVVEASYGNPKHPVTLVRTGSIPDRDDWLKERAEKSLAVTGMVLDVDAEQNYIFLYLEGLFDEETEAWVPLLPELPGWALDGTVFSADMSESVETFADLRARPWALRNVRHTPRPYLSLSDLQALFSERIKEVA